MKSSHKRYAGVLALHPEKIADYQRLHQAVWPEVLRLIHEAHIRNYSIFMRRLPDGVYYLFSYFEYLGTDFAADMARMSSHPVTQAWWAECKPCQAPLPDRAPEEWWASMEEVFHTP